MSGERHGPATSVEVTRAPPVTILTSAVGLGIYVPALLIERQLRRLEVDAEVEVLESYFTPEKRRSHLAQKSAHHSNFALALLAHRMAGDVQDCLDPQQVPSLLSRWAEQGRVNFIVWSGFWLPLLDQYRVLVGNRALSVDSCRIDAELSASFKPHQGHRPDENEIWLWNGELQKLLHHIPVTAQVPLPFGERDKRLVVHGGGWGIGTFQTRALELGESGFALDVVVHDLSEAKQKRQSDRCFMVDPSWHPWTRNAEGRHEFPPMGEVPSYGATIFRNEGECHEFYRVIRRSQAIISKPGGGTLIDSLSSATPLILLEPYGYAEQRNAEVWEHLGFGISYAAWKQAGYSSAVLEGLHRNLLAGKSASPDYTREYAQRLRERRGSA